MIYRFHLSFLPPTINHAYVNRKTGGRFLSKEGKMFKESAAKILKAKYRDVLRGLDENAPYGLGVRFSFPAVENIGWPKRARRRYKKFDVSNRIKLLEDAFCNASGLDDSQFLTLVLEKRAAEMPHTELWLWDYADPVPDEFGASRK